MTERPILFSAPMVCALLAGTKTQTRRAMKPQPTEDFRPIAVEWYSPVVVKRGEDQPGADIFGVYGEEEGYKCPYGAPGDRLWVRETFNKGWLDGGAILYRANGGSAKEAGYEKEPRWTPGIHMPRAVSRITLEVTGVRVERVQDITEADAIAEGIVHSKRLDGFGDDEGRYFHCSDPRRSYEQLWEHINGEGSWEANPWVWVIEFKRSESAEGDRT